MQNNDLSVQKKSAALGGKRIAVAVCGGIGAVEIIKIIRELRRHGAEIYPYMSQAAKAFITELSVSWASGRSVRKEEDFEVDHLEGYDCVLMAPATLNSLSKVALGITDSAVTLLMASQIGLKKPVLIIPTMNLVLWNHPSLKTNLEKLRSWGCQLFEGTAEEDRLKMPAPTVVAEWLMEKLK